MTLPNPTLEPGTPAQVGVQVGTEIVSGPDGTPWVKLHLALGLTMVALVIPEATADQLGKILADQLAQGAANARRAKLGLIVPDPGQKLPMPIIPPNGAKR